MVVQSVDFLIHKLKKEQKIVVFMIDVVTIQIHFDFLGGTFSEGGCRLQQQLMHRLHRGQIPAGAAVLVAPELSDPLLQNHTRKI